MTVRHHFRVIQGCPCPELIAPYIYLVLQGATVNSIYRGSDAEAILHKHGKHSQAELYEGFIHHRPGFAPANPPGFSTHELKSDGAAYPGIPRGHDLEWWMQGFDVNDAMVEAVERQARLRGWELFRPYPSGVEFHHLNFLHEPVPTGKLGSTKARVEQVRESLPRS